MLKNFRAEIEHLLDTIPKSLWNEAAGLSVEYFPWHEEFWIGVRLDDEDPEDPSSWEHYEGQFSDNKRIKNELGEYKQALKYANDKQFAKLEQAVDVLFRHFEEIAEALLSIDYSKYTDKAPFLDAKNLNPDFLLQASNPDDGYGINYCDDSKLISRFYKKPSAKKVAAKKPVAKSATPKKSSSPPAKKTITKKKTAATKPDAKSKSKPSPTKKRPKK